MEKFCTFCVTSEHFTNDCPRRNFSSIPTKIEEAKSVLGNAQRQKKWRVGHPEAYKTYQRNYMKQARLAKKVP